MSDDNTVRIEFDKAADFRLIAADGAWGGPTPRGRIMVNFFVDVPVSPYSVTHELSPDGQLGPEVDRSPSHDEGTPRVAREVQVGILLSPEDAEGIAHWLLEQVELLRGEDPD